MEETNFVPGGFCPLACWLVSVPCMQGTGKNKMQVSNGSLESCWSLFRVKLGLRISHLCAMLFIIYLCCGSCCTLSFVTRYQAFVSVYMLAARDPPNYCCKLS